MRSVLLAVALLAGCPKSVTPEPVPEAPMQAESPNPLLQPWTGPHGGVPPFAGIKTADFEPALTAATEEMMAEIDTIADNTEPATFENTIAALDLSGETFSHVRAVYGVYGGTMSDDELRGVQREMAPVLAGIWDNITGNKALFGRIDTIYNGDIYATLNPEQQRLTWDTYNSFVKSGAKLGETEKSRLADVNQELASLYTTFSQNLLHDEEQVTVLAETDLDGLSDGYITAAKAAAEERELEGYAVVNTRSSVDPFLTMSARRDLREIVWRLFTDRGDNADEYDNNALIPQILTLRRERAQLLGYETHAHWRLEDAMAGNPDNAMALMMDVWPAAVARVSEEVADMQAIADTGNAGITIEPWDYHFYQEKVRKDRYDLDEAEITPYMDMERLREGMMWASTQLYGLQWQQVEGLPVVHPDVRVWEVMSAEGEHVGLWYFDPYARTGKRSGAWMNAYRPQAAYPTKQTILVSNTSNFVKAPEGEPTLISWDDANTLFHEFGHALHGLLSDVTYSGLSGTNVARDFVEYPSQLNEHWLGTPEMLEQFALHAETGEAMPAELLEKIERAATFNQGFGTTEYLASALVDMKLHLLEDPNIDVDTWERETLAELGMPTQLVMRHRTPQFAHVFSGDGYSAGYYSYLWSDTLTADTAEAFVEAGSMYDQATAQRLRDTVLSVGNTVDSAEAFRNFRGRDVDTSALLRSRGFPVE
ncbi:MAG: peptidyl-dipeptidase Dcp [Myxococcota bacterium]|jgi:peptidyl-dipeptidase Dcp